jgi:NADH:ubiquinone oxidoreductase subunit 5 (subunit L)/multisubunit Na+/H+ antiporter MnhA subunit
MIAPYPVSGLLHAVAVVKAGLFCANENKLFIHLVLAIYPPY